VLVCRNGLGSAGMKGRAVFSFRFFWVGCMRLRLDAGLIQKVGQSGQNYRDFRDLFSCTILTKDFLEKGYILSTLSKNQICFPATWQPDGHFRDLFSCTILTKTFRKTGSKLPGLPGFYSGRGRTRGANIPAHLPAMNPDKALAAGSCGKRGSELSKDGNYYYPDLPSNLLRSAEIFGSMSGRSWTITFQTME